MTYSEGVAIVIEDVKVTYQDREGSNGTILPSKAKGGPWIRSFEELSYSQLVTGVVPFVIRGMSWMIPLPL